VNAVHVILPPLACVRMSANTARTSACATFLGHYSLPKSIALSQVQLQRIAKALADPRRHEILRQIGAGTKGVACSDVRECQSVTAATLSHHLKELETAGLIQIIRKGKFAHLQVQRDVLKAYLNHLGSI
jgi:ArsR family transcriptional regulator, arsenate/arsenite/antimonite-responsive transcriptional repressor